MRDHDDPLTTPGGLAKATVAQGRISLARIDQSVRRILLLKQRCRLLPHLDSQGAPVVSAPGVASGEPQARRSA